MDKIKFVSIYINYFVRLSMVYLKPNRTEIIRYRYLVGVGHGRARQAHSSPLCVILYYSIFEVEHTSSSLPTCVDLRNTFVSDCP